MQFHFACRYFVRTSAQPAPEHPPPLRAGHRPVELRRRRGQSIAPSSPSRESHLVRSHNFNLVVSDIAADNQLWPAKNSRGYRGEKIRSFSTWTIQTCCDLPSVSTRRFSEESWLGESNAKPCRRRSSIIVVRALVRFFLFGLGTHSPLSFRSSFLRLFPLPASAPPPY